MPKKTFSILAFLMSFSAFAADPDITVVNDREISVDFSKYKIHSPDYTKAAMRAFYGRNWEVLSRNETRVTGKLFDREDVSSAEVDFSQAPIIHIKYIDDDKAANIGYLHNIKRDILDKLLSCS